MVEHSNTNGHRLATATPLAMIAIGVPLFMWSALYAGFFDLRDEAYVIPLALFVGGPIALGTAIWAYSRADGFLGAALGAFGGFWASYGVLLWMMARDVIPTVTSPSDLRGLLFAIWAVAFGIVWLGSMRARWTLALVMLGVTAQFVLLSAGEYMANTNITTIGGWVGLVTAAIAGYSALAEMVNAEFEQRVLPTGTLRLRTR